MTSHRSAAKRRLPHFSSSVWYRRSFSDLTDMLRDVVNRVREQERLILDICVNECGMPRRDFIASFPKNETNLDWVSDQAKGKAAVRRQPRSTQ